MCEVSFYHRNELFLFVVIEIYWVLIFWGEMASEISIFFFSPQLFSSRRRVRIFLMDAEEEDEDEGGEEEEEGDDPGDQSGELNSSEAHEREMQIDETEMDENKENTSFDNSAEREADTSADREADISATFNEIVWKTDYVLSYIPNCKPRKKGAHTFTVGVLYYKKLESSLRSGDSQNIQREKMIYNTGHFLSRINYEYW